MLPGCSAVDLLEQEPIAAESCEIPYLPKNGALCQTLLPCMLTCQPHVIFWIQLAYQGKQCASHRFLQERLQICAPVPLMSETAAD